MITVVKGSVSFTHYPEFMAFVMTISFTLLPGAQKHVLLSAFRVIFCDGRG